MDITIKISFMYHNKPRIGTIEKMEKKTDGQLVTIRHDEGTSDRLYSSYYTHKMTDLKIGV